jgi:hypothetical protein
MMYPVSPMNPMSPFICGREEYAHLIDAIRTYERFGYRYVDAPWAVSKQAMDITRPTWAGAETLRFVAGGVELCPVASAEQSFLQMQMDANKATRGPYVAFTPCFRNEPVVDDLHQPYFMKVELIYWLDPEGSFTEHEVVMHRMIDHARRFFESYIDTDIVPNTELAQSDPVGVGGAAFDVVSLRSGTEIGSYGIRQHPLVGRWVYGTGCAEPRLTYVMKRDGIGG